MQVLLVPISNPTCIFVCPMEPVVKFPCAFVPQFISHINYKTCEITINHVRIILHPLNRPGRLAA
ncbi:hypothetical protein QET40_12400 [Akkermansia sp. N21169]|nr:hypothetical protein [Akkermansia sp. N21169]